MWFLGWCRKVDFFFFVITGTGFVVGFMKCWVYGTDLDSEILLTRRFFPARSCQDLLPAVFVQLVLKVQLHCQPVLQAQKFLRNLLFCMAEQEIPKFSSLFRCLYMVYSGAENKVFTIPTCCVTLSNEIWTKIFCRNTLLHKNNLVKRF